MMLCEIGNTHYHFMHKGRIWRKPVHQKPELPNQGKDCIYTISVNPLALKKLAALYLVVDLSRHITLDSGYRGLGVDRAVACMAVSDGVVVDAGSAITVDVMQDGVHLGGFIYPGLTRFGQLYGAISPVLKKALNFAVDIHNLPQSTGDAISFGVIAPLIYAIERISKDKTIVFTGGDGGYLARFFEGSIVDRTLIFKGMEKIIKEL